MSARWDDDDVPSLAGKVAVVTGANAGLGLEAAKVLADRGAKVVLACRNVAKAETAARDVRGLGSAVVDVVPLDLASLASVAEAARRIRERESQLDLLVNNAGLMAVDESRTEDGFEMQIGVNHLGHFALTAHLAPLVLATPGSRVVTVSSVGHRMARLRLDDLSFDTRRYDRWRPYFQSKLANLLFAVELHRRLSAAGAPTSSLAAHPGVSNTDLGHEGSGLTNRVIRPFMPMMPSSAAGALPILRAATDPAARGGQFYGPRFVVAGHPAVETPSRRARRAGDGARLWERSEELTGVRFTIPAR